MEVQSHFSKNVEAEAVNLAWGVGATSISGKKRCGGPTGTEEPYWTPWEVQVIQASHGKSGKKLQKRREKIGCNIASTCVENRKHLKGTILSWDQAMARSALSL